jgi:hypothetical protein
MEKEIQAYPRLVPISTQNRGKIFFLFFPTFRHVQEGYSVPIEKWGKIKKIFSPSLVATLLTSVSWDDTSF